MGGRDCHKPKASQHRTNAGQVRLNRRLCQAAEEGGALALLALSVQEREQLNLINLSTVFHRLARLVKDAHCVQVTQNQQFKELLPALQIELGRQTSAKTDGIARCLSTLAWSCATMQLRDDQAKKIMNTIAELSVHRLAEFKSFELTNLLWAFAKVELEHASLFQRAQARIESHLSMFSASNLATIVWTFATAGHRHHHIFKLASETFVSRLNAPGGQAHPVEIANLMWGLATAQYHPRPRILMEIGSAATRIVSEFKLQELSITLWAFSRLGASHDELFAAAARLFVCSPQYQDSLAPQTMSNVLWAFAKQTTLGNSASPFLVSAADAVLPACERLLPILKPQELCSTLWALSRLNTDARTACRLLQHLAALGLGMWKNPTLPNCVGLLSALATLAQTADTPPDGFADLWVGVAQACLRRQSELEAASAIQLLEMSNLQTESLPLLGALFDKAALVCIRDAREIQMSGIIRLASCKFQLSPQRSQSLIGAMAQRILQLGIKTLHAPERDVLAQLCRRQGLNPERLQASLLTLQQRSGGDAESPRSEESEQSGAPPLHPQLALSLSSCLPEPGGMGAVPPAFCGLHMTNVYPQLALGNLVMSPLAFLKTNELSMSPAVSAHGPDMTEKDASSADECSTEYSAASMSESDTGDAFYEVKNTFVHIPNIKSADRRLKASKFLSERCHRRAAEA